MIIETQKSIFNIMASTNANRFIYYFKRIPIVGKKLPESIYGNLTLKRNVSVIAAILKAFRSLIGKALYIGLLFVLPVILIEKDTLLRYSSYINVAFMISAIGSFLSSSVFTADRNGYICVKLMHMDAKSYAVTVLFFNELKNVLSFLPIMILSTFLMGGTVVQGVLLAIISEGFGLTGETFFLIYYSKTKKMISNKTLYEVCVGALCIIAAYGPILLHKPIQLSNWLFNPLFIVLILILSIFCVFYILRYKRYHEIAMLILKASNFTLDTNKLTAEARFSDVAVREKEFKESDLKSNKFEKKEGFAYLNSIFFARHKRLLVKPIAIRLILIAILFIAGLFTCYFNPDFLKPLSNSSLILPAFVFIMYMISIGERVCKAMFYNCDISLLKYSFYRNKKAILSNFATRLLWISCLNLIVAFALAAATVLLAVIFKLNWPLFDIISFVLSILFLSLFFSVHHLFLYYVFQPYTTELGMKNPYYSVINYIVYFICFLSMKIKSPPSYFVFIVLVSTFIYIVTALILVYKYAPKTFRIK